MDNESLKNKFDISLFIKDNKDTIPALLCYVFGLFFGSIIAIKFSVFNSVVNMFLIHNQPFLTIFTNNLCLFLCLFCITVLLGVCIIGFPIINLVPFIMGIEIALKISYFYTQFSSKGIGYCLLIICPEASAFLTIILYSITNSNMLSKQLFDLSTKNSDTLISNDIKMYLNNYLKYLIAIVIICIINTVAEYLFGQIISI